MAPEQVLGDKPIDERSDIYSVGCLAYWLVTGQLVFTGRTPIDTMLQHAQAKPLPPSKRTELNISGTFDQLILACLEKRPDQRPSTAETLAARLAGIEAAGSWSQHLARQPVGRASPENASVDYMWIGVTRGPRKLVRTNRLHRAFSSDTRFVDGPW